MRPYKLSFVALSAAAAAIVAACGGNGKTGFPHEGNGGGAGSSGGAGGSGGLAADGGLTGGGPDASCDGEGCACPNKSATKACWTGPADMRGVGACHDGTQTCSQNGEFWQWGPCVGEQLNCGVGEGGGGYEDGGCSCIPGAIILCDANCTENIYCEANAQKTCQPDGTWGPCVENNNKKFGALGGGPNDPCAYIGEGCSGCNNGKGWYIGDCSKQLKCDPNKSNYCPPSMWHGYSDQGSNNGGSAMCNCN